METKHVRLDLKVNAEGKFTGLLSPYGPPADQGGDIIERGAFAKNLKEKGNIRPLLWSHETNNPVGSVTLEDKTDGLYVQGELLMDLPEAQKVYRLIKSGIVKGLSIGYRVIREDMQNGVRMLKEIVLFEASAVLFPMNENALITSVKSVDRSDVHTALVGLARDVIALRKSLSPMKGRK